MEPINDFCPSFHITEILTYCQSCWLSRKIIWLIDLQNSTGLVRQTCIVVLDIIILVDRVFTSFPKEIGKSSLVFLNYVGILYLGEIAQDIQKSLLDLPLAILNRDIKGFSITLLKTIAKTTDCLLLIGFFCAAQVKRLGLDLEAKKLYTLMLPFGIMTFAVNIALTINDLYTNKLLFHELKAIQTDNRLEITRLFCTFILNPISAEALKNESRLAIRVIRQLPLYNMKNFNISLRNDLDDWQPGTPLQKQHIDRIIPYFDKVVSAIELQLWDKSADANLIVLGYAAMGISKCYPNSVIQSISETSMAILWWFKSFSFYMSRK